MTAGSGSRVERSCVDCGNGGDCRCGLVSGTMNCQIRQHTAIELPCPLVPVTLRSEPVSAN